MRVNTYYKKKDLIDLNHKIYRKWARMKSIWMLFQVFSQYTEYHWFHFSTQKITQIDCDIPNAQNSFEFGGFGFLDVQR